MPETPSRRAFLAFVLLSAAVAAQHGPQLTYFVEVKPDDRSAFHYALDIDRPGVDEIALSVPAWAPGSYRLIKAADGIEGVAAVDETGAARAVTKDGDLTWRVAAKGAAKIRVVWRFTKLTDRRDNRSYMAKTGALLDGPRNYLYWRDRKDLSAHVVFKVPEKWTVASGLDPTFDPSTFVAKNADWLIDCPVLMGELVERRFTVRNVPHRLVIDPAGREPKYDLDAFVDCCKRCVEAASDLMGGLPYDHYTFLFVSGGGGGLEHLTSTTIGITPMAMQSNPYSHQGVIAHEHFHAWNVKRLRPFALGPFDYDGPVRTKSLWWAEGVTDYYTEVILARAGLVSDEEFFGSFERRISAYVRNDYTRVISPEENSWTVWDGVYLAGPVSYYDQGAVLGLLMDLEIRGRTAGAKSLDDALRLLYRRHSGARGFQSEDLVTGIYDATGVDLHAFFLRHVSAAHEPDWARAFAYAGMIADSGSKPAPAFSFTAETEEGGAKLKDLPERSAAVRFGLRNGDVVKAVNGAATGTPGRLTRVVRDLAAGSEAVFKVVRDGKETEVKGTVEAATDLARARFGREDATFTAVVTGSSLDRAGLREGDVLTAVGAEKIRDAAHAKAALAGIRAGETARLGYRRGTAESAVDVRAEAYLAKTFSLKPDPNASPEALRVRKGLVFGPRGEALVAPPKRKAG